MPTYLYKDLQTGEIYELVQRMRDEAYTTHPDTGAAIKRVPVRPAIAFKGSGFYANDSRRPAPSSAASSPASDGAAGSGSASGAASTGAAGSSTAPSNTATSSTATSSTAPSSTGNAGSASSGGGSSGSTSTAGKGRE